MIKINVGAMVVTRGRYVEFQSRSRHPLKLFGDILRLIAELRPPLDPAPT